MFRLLKKTFAVCMIGFGSWNALCIVTSFMWLAIYYWRNYNYSWSDFGYHVKGECIYMTIVVKKGSQIFAWVCKIYIWNKRLIHIS